MRRNKALDLLTCLTTTCAGQFSPWPMRGMFDHIACPTSPAAGELNERPRMTLRQQSPAEGFQARVASTG